MIVSLHERDVIKGGAEETERMVIGRHITRTHINFARVLIANY